jgi:hypothetical protein
VNYFIFEQVKKIIRASSLRIITQEIVTKLSKIWVGDPGSGENLSQIPDPGVKKALDPGSATLITLKYFTVISLPYSVRHCCICLYIFIVNSCAIKPVIADRTFTKNSCKFFFGYRQRDRQKSWIFKVADNDAATANPERGSRPSFLKTML